MGLSFLANGKIDSSISLYYSVVWFIDLAILLGCFHCLNPNSVFQSNINFAFFIITPCICYQNDNEAASQWCEVNIIKRFSNRFLLIDIKHVAFKFWYLLWDNNSFSSLATSGSLYTYSCKENNKINLCKSCVGHVTTSLGLKVL